MDTSQLLITEKEETGVWFNRNGASFLVCSLAKPAYKAAYAKKLAEHLRERRHSVVTEEMDVKFTSELFAEYILVDWKGLTEKGQPLAYSKAKALEFLSNPRMRLLDWVKQWANEEAVFQNNLDSEGVESLKKG
jgi:hypothetical protein